MASFFSPENYTADVLACLFTKDRLFLTKSYTFWQ
jgi:hypothetical protein